MDALRTVPGVEVLVLDFAVAPRLLGAEPPDLVIDLRANPEASAGTAEVWSFRLDRSNDPTLPFARELAHGARTFEIALERRRPGQPPAVLRSGHFAFTGWYPSTLRLAFAQAARWPATLIAAQRDGAFLEPIAAASTSAPRNALGWVDRLRFAAILIRGVGALVVRSWTEVTEWNVGTLAGDARTLLSGEPLAVRWLPRPARGTFIADPFVVERDGKRVIFVERFDADVGRGTIEALEMSPGGEIRERAQVLDVGTHLSYPFPLEIEGTLYLVPENCEADEVALYRCVEFPWRWEREDALFPGLDATDTTIFEHGGRWWALHSRYSHGDSLALYAHHAPSPRGPWQPHALNPVVCDVSRARPAGMPFVVDGALYRPGQDCTRSYGGGLTIARVDELTPLAYRETVVRRIDARGFGRWRNGVHHVSFGDGIVVLDGKHTGYDLSRPLKRLLGRRATGGAAPA